MTDRLDPDRLTRPSSRNTQPSHSRTPRLGCVEEGLFFGGPTGSKRAVIGWGTLQGCPGAFYFGWGKFIIRSPGAGVVNFPTELFTPSLWPLACIESTV